RYVQREMDLLVRALLVAVVKRVDHALTHAHTDAVAHLFIEACRLGHTEAHLLRQIYTFNLRIQDYFQVLVLGRHARVSHRANCMNLGLCMGNTMGFLSSMEGLA